MIKAEDLKQGLELVEKLDVIVAELGKGVREGWALVRHGKGSEWVKIEDLCGDRYSLKAS